MGEGDELHLLNILRAHQSGARDATICTRTSLTVGAASSNSASNFLLKAMAVYGGEG